MDDNIPQMCEHCGRNVGEEQIDPYIQEMSGEEVWVVLCEQCSEDCLGDI